MKLLVLMMLLAFVILGFVQFANSDELSVPFSCWPIELQEAFNNVGVKLDLSPNERTIESWGYILSKGSSYSIYTYQSAKKEDFELIRKLVFDIETGKEGLNGKISG